MHDSRDICVCALDVSEILTFFTVCILTFFPASPTHFTVGKGGYLPGAGQFMMILVPIGSALGFLGGGHSLILKKISHSQTAS